jgi:hypothetical protein
MEAIRHMRLRLRSILVTLLLVAVCCSGRTINATTAQGTDTSTIQLIGSLGGSATRVQVVGTHAYVGGPDNLRIVDVSDPSSPAVIGSYASAVEDLQVIGNLAYLAGPNGLRIVSVADQAHLVLRGSYDLPPIGQTYSQRASRVQVVGEYAYVIFQETIFGIPPYRSELAIVDVRDRSRPVLISRYDLGPSFNDLAVRDGYAYIGGTTDVGGTARFFDAYLLILDVRDPAIPTRIGRYQNDVIFIPTGSGGFALVDDLVYLGMGNGPALYTLDVHDRTHPTPLGSLAINASDLRVVGQFAYVADIGAGLTIVDIRDPAAPVQRASYGPLGYPLGVDVAGDLVYVASDTGLRIVRFLPRTTALIPAGGGTLEATVGRVSYQFPAGVFAETAAVTHTLHIADDIPPAPAHIHIGPAFEITASYSATGQLAQPAMPITITVGYTDSERAAAVADTPALYYWDGSAWVKEPSSVLDQTARTVTATSKRLGIWALMGDARRALLPILRR